MDADSGARFVGVPLQEIPKSEQQEVGRLVERACGRPPKCPRTAILEQWALERIKERARVAAANAKVK